MNTLASLLPAVIILGYLAIWIWLIMDIIHNPNLGAEGRVLWLIVVVFGSVIGIVLYLVFGKRPGSPRPS